MPYPWPSFGSFYFNREEWPIYGTDTNWNTKLTQARSRPLGTATDSVVTLAVGSLSRSFECYLSPTRFSSLRALLNTTEAFVDWQRPTPGNQEALLSGITRLGSVRMKCSDGTTRERIRTRVELISQ